MKPIEIHHEDLHYILCCARCQLREWHKAFGEKEDEIYLNKVENILAEIRASPAMDFTIDEMPF